MTKRKSIPGTGPVQPKKNEPVKFDVEEARNAFRPPSYLPRPPITPRPSTAAAPTPPSVPRLEFKGSGSQPGSRQVSARSARPMSSRPSSGRWLDTPRSGRDGADLSRPSTARGPNKGDGDDPEYYRCGVKRQQHVPTPRRETTDQNDQNKSARSFG